ncbi:MAG: pilus (MSHA type) biogenesis protein MshL [Desulfosarcinaceae bacterium]|nr:pilus (MSHA type) biogenesis protein MshL [Desulfosarcinaceae bacterium]
MKPVALWLLTLSVLAGGCSYGPASLLHPKTHAPEEIPAQIETASQQLGQAQASRRRQLESQDRPQAVALAPIMPVYDPLADQKVSFAVVDEELQIVLYALAEAVDMNVIIDPQVPITERRLTLNFREVSASTVLQEILAAYDLYHEIEGRIIRVKPFQEQIFRLNFLDTIVNTSFDMGGDVLGAGETDTATGLAGSFKLSGTGGAKSNPYDTLETMLKPVLSKGGRYALNRMAGSLYVKDSPHVVRSVARLVQHFKETLGRQIQIEARIIEVALSDEYQYGINWEALRNLSDGATLLNSASWSLGNGMILTGQSGEWSLGSAVNALNSFGDAKVVSNPSIRSKHGKPAMISVGTSFTYKKSVETTTTNTATDSDTTTEVEVSTVFDGLILGVVPFIEDNGHISLMINPIKSDVDQESLEPESVGDGQSISLPEVRIKELSTTIDLHDGDVVILGGLIDQETVTDDRGVPFLSAIPVLGYLFKNELSREQTRELVIILSVNLV